MEEEVIDSSFFSEDLEEKSSIDVKKTGFENSFNERQIGSITMAIPKSQSVTAFLLNIRVILSSFPTRCRLSS